MAEYIDKEKLLLSIHKAYCEECDKAGAWCRACWVDDMRLEIADAPTEDVVGVVHGEWMENDLSVWADCPTDGYPAAVCSVCGMRFCDIINNIGWMYNHCPHCGAKMDGKDGKI